MTTPENLIPFTELEIEIILTALHQAEAHKVIAALHPREVTEADIDALYDKLNVWPF